MSNKYHDEASAAVRYDVQEAFASIQGEGIWTGSPALFCRFRGCNLWDGTEEGRARALCRVCDTDFIAPGAPGGGRFSSPDALIGHLVSLWPHPADPALSRLVFTGGEPLLQLDAPLIAEARRAGFSVAVETNGTRPLPAPVDWLTVSPKPGAPLRLREGDELKLLYPNGLNPQDFEGLPFRHFLLQPVDGPDREASLRAVLDYIRAHPAWGLSLQWHKRLGVR